MEGNYGCRHLCILHLAVRPFSVIASASRILKGELRNVRRLAATSHLCAVERTGGGRSFGMKSDRRYEINRLSFHLLFSLSFCFFHLHARPRGNRCNHRSVVKRKRIGTYIRPIYRANFTARCFFLLRVRNNACRRFAIRLTLMYARRRRRFSVIHGDFYAVVKARRVRLNGRSNSHYY